MATPRCPAAVRSDRHGGPDHVGFLHEDGVDVGFDGVEPRRHEDARGVGTHLVYVVDDLRMPHVVQLGDGQLRFLLREHVPVAIVVVADVFLVKLGRAGALEGRAKGAAVPARYDIHAIRIERWHQQEDGVFENGAEAGRVLGEQAIGELYGGLGGCQLRRVNRAGDQDDGLAFGDQLLGFGFRSQAGIGQASLDFAVAVQVAQRLGRCDGGGNERAAFGALAQLIHADAVGIGLDRLKIGDDLVPVEDQMVRAHALAKE